ncbi:MAG: glutamate racemase [Bacteroidetes bacterium]|jgi:glutamate racemase|nr:glutamate racemase [Bacteroidota bacterium]
MNDRTAQPIGVFDSGIGGLTVVRSLLRHLPHENIVYFGDTARVPYGSKSPQVVREYTLQDTDVLLKHNVKMIVVACNTVSAVALDVVQKRAGAGTPVMGVILPGATAAVAATRNKRIGIIGTQGTIASRSYTNAIRELDPAVEVFGQACPLFVPLAEEGWTDHKATELIAREYLHPLVQQKVDTVVLACTHYPILSEVIQRIVPPAVRLIDSGEATGHAVAELLGRSGELNPSTLAPNLQFFVSDIPYKFTEVGERFLGARLGRVQRVGGLG